MREYGSNINLPSLDNLFSSEQERQDAKLEKIQILPLTELHPFRNHPFQVRDDDEMDKMVDSIKEYGVMTPAIVRPRQDGGYEIVAGHRRCHASQRAGVETMPCIVRDMDDDTAIILMVDSNCQREHILPSEKAKAYEMKLAAIKRQGQRRDLTSGQVVQKLSVQEVADGSGEGYKTVQRFIRLNKLTPELMKMVDDGKLKTTPAVELSYLTPEEQEDFLSYMESEGCTPSLSQAQKLKEASKESVLTPEKIQHIMAAKPPSVKPRDPQLMIPVAKVERYFPKGFTSDQMQQVIVKLLENYARALERSKKMMQIIDTAIDLMRRKHKKGEFYYWILYYAYLSPQQCENAGAILQSLETKGISISLRTYYVHRDEAIEVLSSILWGYTSQDCEKITNLLTPD